MLMWQPVAPLPQNTVHCVVFDAVVEKLFNAIKEDTFMVWTDMVAPWSSAQCYPRTLAVFASCMASPPASLPLGWTCLSKPRSAFSPFAPIARRSTSSPFCATENGGCPTQVRRYAFAKQREEQGRGPSPRAPYIPALSIRLYHKLPKEGGREHTDMTNSPPPLPDTARLLRQWWRRWRR